MNALDTVMPQADVVEAMRGRFASMHAATRRTAEVELHVRQRRLDGLLQLLRENGERFVEAIAADFGHRSPH